MKVDMNHTPETKQADMPAEREIPDTNEAPGSERVETETSAKSEGNVYLEALKDYKEKVQKEAKEKGFFKSTKFWIILIIVLFVVFISANNKMSGKSTRLQSQIRNTQTEINKLNTATDDLKMELEEQAKIEAVTMTQEEEDLARNDAKVQGAMVADLQNKYLDIDSEYMPQIINIEAQLAKLRDEDETGNTEKMNELEKQEKDLDSAKYSEITDVKGKLDAYFDENGKRSGKGIWYNYNTNGIAGKWEFATNATFKGNTTKVLWLCYDKNHKLLSYATSRYDADTKLFGDVVIMLTSYAEANITNDDDMMQQSISEQDGTENLSLTEQLTRLAESGDIDINTPPADEEFDQETIDMNNDVTDAREEYKNKVASGEVAGEEFSTNYIVGLQGYDGAEDQDEGQEDQERGDDDESDTEYTGE